MQIVSFWPKLHKFISSLLPASFKLTHCLTHWGRVTHICVSKLTIIGSENGLSPVRRQAIIWTNAGILLIELLGTNFSEILIGIQSFSFKTLHLKMSFAKCRLFCLGLNVLRYPRTFGDYRRWIMNCSNCNEIFTHLCVKKTYWC